MRAISWLGGLKVDWNAGNRNESPNPFDSSPSSNNMHLSLALANTATNIKLKLYCRAQKPPKKNPSIVRTTSISAKARGSRDME
ncbi:hypothetical protein BofuT4_P050310.1 [Botrytis cinerea T4]|uniref:Uncharacterized protein n=1 Tax=Botryotinia fuckeliana (strain T4) TaxID=999810 RepID=G2XZX6_BOTF4|nr:hypothetical protein BofuT4_P050310.1 [Botrytis cinerea T4]